MRRKEKEISDRTKIEEIIHKSTVCRLGVAEGDIPYIIPMNFAYHDNTIYLHSALKGRKINTLRKNPNVCFEFDVDNELEESENACEWGMKYQSVIGFGKASFVNDQEQKRKALDLIMHKYSGKSFRMPESAIDRTAVIKIDIATMTGKQSGF